MKIKMSLGSVDVAMQKNPVSCSARFAKGGFIITRSGHPVSPAVGYLVPLEWVTAGHGTCGWQYGSNVTAAQHECTLYVPSRTFLFKRTLFVPGVYTWELVMTTQRMHVEILTGQCFLCFLFHLLHCPSPWAEMLLFVQSLSEDPLTFIIYLPLFLMNLQLGFSLLLLL